MADRFVLAVVGLAELGHLLEEGKPEDVDVVTVAGGPGADRRLAQAVRGATRDSLLCVVADTGDETTNRLPARLSRGGVRVVALTGLPGASGHFGAHPNLRTLSAPFTLDDVLAELSALPGDVPFLLPVTGGDRVFGDAAGPGAGREPDLVDVIIGRDDHGTDVTGLPEPGAGWDVGDGAVVGPAGSPGPVGMAGDGDPDDPLGDYATPELAPALDGLPAWARIPTPPRPGGAPDPVPGWLAGPHGAGAATAPLPAPPPGALPGGAAAPDPAPGWLAGGQDAPGPLSDYAARALHDPPVVAGMPLPARPATAGPARSAVLSICSYKGGSGKCLTGDALVTDPVTGLLRRLDDVVRDPGHRAVLTLDGDTVRAAPITAKVDSGVQPTLRLALRSGRSVTATPHHPFLMAGGWRRADRIAPGEEVAVPARLPLPERPCRLSAPEMDRLVAHVVGGCGRPGTAMPVAAFRLPGDQLARLVGAVWAAAGPGPGDGPPAVTLASGSLARGLQHLLLRLGIQSAVTPLALLAPAGAPAWAGPAGGSGQSGQPPGGGARSGPWQVAVHPSGVGALAAVTVRGTAGRDPAPSGGAGDVFWDEVVAIAPAGDQQVWDLSVEPTRCFVANDVVVHNTTTAMMAAGALARAVGPAGKRVALVDANTAQSSISTIVRQPPRGTILDLVRTDVDGDLLAGALTPAPEVGSLDILFGAPDLRRADDRLVTPALYRRVVAGLRRTHDYVVVDTPVAEAVGHELFDDFVLRDSDRVIVVVDPNRETIENNVEWLDIIGDPVSAGGRNFPPERIGIVLNRAEESLDWDAEAVGRYFRRYQFLGGVPHSAAVQRAADDGCLLDAFDAAVERAVRGVLAHLVAEPAFAPEPPAGRSGVDRFLARLFAGRGGR
ncbi:MAG TPA: hypothetical protein VFP06_09850 [Acidimicrobiales bacterium]|nr:hypothetical protein [Acidimicrobiales bacterium]